MTAAVVFEPPDYWRDPGLMKTVLVNYASPEFEPYRTINRITGLRAGFDECLSFGPADIDDDFASENDAILSQPRGAGYWLWKPYFVSRVLSEVDYGDYVFYCDSAVHFVGSVAPLLELARHHALSMVLFGEGFRESQYTKRDAFVLMECDSPEFSSTPQRFASYFLLEKTEATIEMVSAYLRFARDSRILTDQENEMGYPDHPDFVDHRHDQSILSLLSKKLGIDVVENELVAEGLAEPAGQFLNHTRAHVAPGRVLQWLVSPGVLRVEDLGELRTAH